MNKKFIFIAITLILIGIVGFRFVIRNTNPTNVAQEVNVDNLRHVTLKIDGMSCMSCVYGIESVLKNIPGVVNVTVGFVKKGIATNEGRGEVVYDATKTSPKKMLQEILPYRGVVLNDEKTSSTQLTPLSKVLGL